MVHFEEEDDSTICKEEPSDDEKDYDPRLAQGHFGCCAAVQHGGPVLGRENLVDGQEGCKDLAKVHRDITLHVAPKELRGEECGEVVDEHEEEHHVRETVHVPEHG